MRYYWLKLKEEFFRDLRVKKLRRGENGAALTLLYLELLLAALPTDGILPLLGMEAPAAELSLLLDAPEENCAALLDFLTAHGLLKDTPEGLYLPMLESCTGSETEAAGRMRKLRAARREQAAPNAEPMQQKADKGPSFFSPEQRANNVQQRDAEIEKEKEKEKEIDPDIETETEAEKRPPAAAANGADDSGKVLPPPLPMQTGEDFYLDETQAAEYARLYPEVNVPAQLCAMRGWLLSNPGQRKPPEAMLRFVNGWLNKEQTMLRNGARRAQAAAPAANERKKAYGGAGYSSAGYSRPPSYDIEAAMLEAMRTVPKVKKRAR